MDATAALRTALAAQARLLMKNNIVIKYGETGRISPLPNQYDPKQWGAKKKEIKLTPSAGRTGGGGARGGPGAEGARAGRVVRGADSAGGGGGANIYNV